MNRRELLKMVALATGGIVIGSEFLLTGCKNTEASGTFSLSEKEIAFLDEVAETIIPTTDTPGAKAAKVGAFMQLIVADCYSANDQVIFKKGLSLLNDACNKQMNKNFIDCTAAEKKSFLTTIDSETKKYQKEKKQDAPNHYFQMMKQLTIFGYFSSEIGATQALRKNPVPGKYDGAYPYKKSDRAWS